MSRTPDIRFGTSSWAYEGWAGLVYHQTYPKSRFSKDSLREYAAYAYRDVPLFRTVGVDHTFYRPPTAKQLAHYAAQVPAGFLFCCKVWEELTIPVYARHPRYGTKGGSANTRFLDVESFADLVLNPTLEGLGPHAGPLLFEFQRTGMDPETFLDRLERFLDKAPVQARCAVEVRNPAILGERYFRILAAHQAAHVYNHWTGMPPLAEQHDQLGRRFPASFVVMRLLTPVGMSYQQAVERAAPYDRIVQPLPRMRQEAVELARESASESRQTFILVNNRAEGSAPLTVQALVDLLNGNTGGASRSTPPAQPNDLRQGSA